MSINNISCHNVFIKTTKLSCVPCWNRLIGVSNIIDIMTACRKRQKQKPEWRKIKYALLKHIQSNIFDQLKDLLQVLRYRENNRTRCINNKFIPL